MLKRILVINLLLLATITQAQVTVNVQLPTAGMIQKDQLWNIVLASSGGLAEVTISLDIQDAVTGQTVLSASGRNIMLGKGVKIISAKDVQPVQYNYLAAELTGNFIPLGSYIACYRVIKNDVKGPEPLGDECVRININPLSPPLLNTPADHSVLETNYPQFSWVPPAPIDMFNALHYDLLIAEVLPGQSLAEAIMYNVPVYTKNNVRTVYESYPTSFSRLKEGQQYAWQVIARNGLNYAAQTEVWSFSIKPSDTLKQAFTSNSYVVLKSKQDVSGINYIGSEELLVKFYSFDKDHETTVKLLSVNGKTVQQVKQKINYGDNFLHFKLNNQFEKGIVYIVELTDMQEKEFRAKFSIQ